MASEEHFRKLERMYRTAPVNAGWSPTISVGDGTCQVILPVRSQDFHAANALHGAVYFRAMDDASFFAVNSLVETHLVLTVSYHVQFLKPVRVDHIRAEGNAYFSSGRLLAGESILYDADGEEVGRGRGLFTRSTIPLSQEIGYK